MHIYRKFSRACALLVRRFAVSCVVSTHELTSNEATRHYLLARPSRPVQGLLPLIIIFHGQGSSAGKVFERESTGGGWLDIVERESALVLAPQGWLDNSGKQRWNDGQAHRDSDSLFDDVWFIAALINKAIAEYGADPSRIYLTGVGNGGSMVFRAAAEIGYSLAAAAVVNALMPNGGSALKLYYPLPIYLCYGADNQVASYAGGEVGGGWANSPDCLDAEASVQIWRELALLPDTPQTQTVTLRDGFCGARSNRYIWGDDPAQIQVGYLRVDDLAHAPLPGNRRTGLESIRREVDGVDLIEDIWTFFKDKRVGVGVRSPARAERFVLDTLQLYKGSSAGYIAGELLTSVATILAPEHFMRFIPEPICIALYLLTRNPASFDQLHHIESHTYKGIFYAGLSDEQVAEKLQRIRRERQQKIYNAYHAVFAYFLACPLSDVQIQIAEAIAKVESQDPYEGIIEKVNGVFRGPGIEPAWREQRAKFSTECAPSPFIENNHGFTVDAVRAYAEQGLFRRYVRGIAEDMPPSALTWGRLQIQFIRYGKKLISQLLLGGMGDGVFSQEWAIEVFLAGYLEQMLRMQLGGDVIAPGMFNKADTSTVPVSIHLVATDVDYVALGMLIGFEKEAFLLARLQLHAKSKGYWGREIRKHYPLHYFMLRLWSQALSEPLAADEITFPLCPFYDSLSNMWLTDDLAMLRDLCLVACDIHTHICKYDERLTYFPIEILLLFKLRAKRGLPNPELDHPLMQSALGKLPEPCVLETDPLMVRVLARMRADGFDEEEIARQVAALPARVPEEFSE